MPPALASRSRGFTLIEIVLAVAILAIISFTIYQFTDTSLRAAAFSVRISEQDGALAGLRRLLSTQLASIPANQNGALVGITIKGNKGGGRRDALQLLCPAGNALLTPDARGLYQVTLDLREIPRGSGRYALGMERQPWDDDDDDDDDDDAPAGRPAASSLKTTDLRPGADKSKMPADWVKLMDGVRSMEFAYFDGRLNGWVDKWTDQTNLPNLVRLRLAVFDLAEPVEIVSRVPAGGLQKVIPTTTFGAGGNLTDQPPGTVDVRTGMPSYIAPSARKPRPANNTQ